MDKTKRNKILVTGVNGLVGQKPVELQYYVFGTVETVQFNFKISRTPENQQCYYHYPGSHAGTWVDGILFDSYYCPS